MEAPDFIYFGAAEDSHFLPEGCFLDQKPTTENLGNLTVDDLLDFSKEDEVMTDGFFDNVAGNSTDSSTVTVVDSCNSSVSSGEFQLSGNVGFHSFPDAQFCGELCVPADELAALEWLSNFVDVEDSFSSDDLQNLQLISATKAPAATATATATATSSSETAINRHNPPLFPADVSVPGKARSKRTRAAPGDWSSRLLVLSPAASSSEPTTATKTPKATPLKKRDGAETTGRKCLHCASEKTPQWRTGPMGPKTLCNACGVRYKSGRLVPEYRPAASPTFMSAKHSNSHRKVVELRRQKEAQRQQFLSQSSIFGASNGEEYLIHYQGGPDYGHMI